MLGRIFSYQRRADAANRKLSEPWDFGRIVQGRPQYSTILTIVADLLTVFASRPIAG
jgi:hypothetical protein